MRKLGIALVVAAALVGRRCCTSEPAPPVWRCATFNIENFPKSDHQVAAAFDEIVRLDAAIVAVQEITDPALFGATARARLGAAWQFVSLDPGNTPHHTGVLFDSAAFSHVATRVHDETRLEGRHKPTLDVELRDRATGGHVRVLVVHLKAGGENQPIRTRQVAALRRIIMDLAGTGAALIVLGDFNATGDADRRDLGRLADATHTHWATEALACSAFWSRDDGCPRSRLDHAISTIAPLDVHATGACETEGCATQDRCPLYRDQVSDHCPVVLTFTR